jgi:outer membrane protein assembly factor BamA
MDKLMIVRGLQLLRLVLVMGTGLCGTPAFALESRDSIPTSNHFKIIALPIAYYTPETRWAVGGGGLATFNFSSDSLGARRSSITFGAVYTQLNQVLLYFPFQLFPKNNQYWISGELAYYKYTYNYFGVGNEQPVEYVEQYDALYPRLQLNLSRQVRSGLFVGLRYAYDDYVFSNLEPGGQLEQGAVTGASGGRVSGLGLGMNFDTRNSIFFPEKGWWIDAVWLKEARWTGSDFRYDRWTLDISRYQRVGNELVWALNGLATLSAGDIPFFQMPRMGGIKRMRGYLDGKYRGQQMVLLQTEFRRPLFWRVGAVVFGGLGWVAEGLGEVEWRHTRYNYGFGFRFSMDRAQKINVRLDFGYGYRSRGTYLTIGEAF